MRYKIFLCAFLLLCPCSALSATYMHGEDEVTGTNVHNDPRRGTVHIWVDPQTGDRITSVRPGQPQENTTPSYNPQNMPIYILPQITPSRPVQPTP